MRHPDFPEVRLVGAHFRGTEAVEYASALQGGEIFSLEREPENLYDQNAIKVVTPGGLHLAYVERGQAAWISGHMDEGATYRAHILRAEPYKNTVHIIADIRADA